MADTFKKLFDTTVNFAELSGNGTKTLYTAAAGESAVIKQVVATPISSDFGPIDLKVDDYAVGELNETTTELNGTQIVPEASVVTAKAQNTLFNKVFKVKYGHIDQPLNRYEALTIDFDGDNFIGEAEEQYSIIGTSITNNNANRNWVYVKENGEVRALLWYTDGNSTSQFFVKTAANVNINSMYDGNSYGAVAYDGGRYAYVAAGADLYEIDLENETKTRVYENTSQNMTISNYPRADMLTINGDRYVFIYSGSSYNKLYIYQSSTGSLITGNNGITMNGLNSYAGASALQTMKATLLSDGKVMLYSAEQNDSAYNNGNNTRYTIVNLSVSPPTNTSAGDFTFNGSWSTYVDAATSGCYGGYFFIEDKVFFKHYNNGNPKIAYCDWNESTKVIDLTTTVKVPTTTIPASRSATDYGGRGFHIEQVTVDYTSQSFDVAAFGIESN